MRTFDRPLAFLLLLLLAPCAPLAAQTIEDGLFMPKKTLCTGFLYTHDRWDEYWEGTLKRANGNVGTITTQSVAWMGTYGITDRLNAIAMLPYLWTGASQGVLQGQSGMQDLTVALKFKLLETPFTGAGSLRTILVATAGTPLSRLHARLPPALDRPREQPPFGARRRSTSRPTRASSSTRRAPTRWRGNVTLDRPAYYTDGSCT